MDLKIKDVAELLRVSETTVRRWLTMRKIPAYRLNHQYRFNRTEIEEWVMSHTGEKRKELFEESLPKESAGTHMYGLYRALHKGDVLLNVPGKTKEEVIENSVSMIAQKMHLDSEVLTELLLDRERLMPTSLNHGFAVPHTRDFLLPGPFDIVFIAYPEEPIAYGALDEKDVHTLFFLFACEDKTHLHLLAKLAHLTSEKENRAFLQNKPAKKEVLSHIKEWESGTKKLTKAL